MTKCTNFRSIFLLRSLCFVPIFGQHINSHKKTKTPIMLYIGSSQHMWGILHGRRFAGLCQGGSSPRMWGILGSLLPYWAGQIGSSPRMWGILSSSTKTLLLSSVHPHACGEYCYNRKQDRKKQRFIPTHVGNTQMYCTGVRMRVRFIPTHVGNTSRPVNVWVVDIRFIPTNVGNTV